MLIPTRIEKKGREMVKWREVRTGRRKRRKRRKSFLRIRK
jgi:hypothetical protein